MSAVGQPERATQNRVVGLFCDELGYRYLGDWTDRDGNSNIEEGLLSRWLARHGYTPAQISVALYKLRSEADNHSRLLYPHTTHPPIELQHQSLNFLGDFLGDFLGEADFDAFIQELESQPSATIGEVFVFVDECHRTHDKKGKLHRVMKAMMPNAVFIGFTGTLLLVRDRATSLAGTT